VAVRRGARRHPGRDAPIHRCFASARPVDHLCAGASRPQHELPLGLRRDLELRANDLLRPRRLLLCDPRAERRVDAVAVRRRDLPTHDFRRRARLLRHLWPHQRYLSQRNHARRHADLRKEHSLHLRPRICHRQRAAERAERHSWDTRPATSLDQLGALHRRRLLSGRRHGAHRLCRLASASPHLVRPHHRRHPRERNKDGASGLRQPRLQTRGLRARRWRCGPFGRALCGLGQFRRARDVQPQPGGAGGDLGHRWRTFDPYRSGRRDWIGSIFQQLARHGQHRPGDSGSRPRLASLRARISSRPAADNRLGDRKRVLRDQGQAFSKREASKSGSAASPPSMA
jgi:hypothetical protein